MQHYIGFFEGATSIGGVDGEPGQYGFRFDVVDQEGESVGTLELEAAVDEMDEDRARYRFAAPGQPQVELQEGENYRLVEQPEGLTARLYTDITSDQSREIRIVVQPLEETEEEALERMQREYLEQQAAKQEAARRLVLQRTKPLWS